MAETKKLMQVKAPMSGVFYKRPGPEEAPTWKWAIVLRRSRSWAYWKP